MATKHWRGDAQVKVQDERLTITNAEPGDVFTVAINSKEISYTLTSADIAAATTGKTNSQIAMDGLLALLVTATSAVPEFTELTASAVNGTDGFISSIKLLGPDDGKPFTTSVSTTDSGSYGVTVTTLQAGSAKQFEKQVIELAGTPTGGTFTLSFAGSTTGAIAYDASAATVDTALEATGDIPSGAVSVTGDAGGPWTVEFTGTFTVGTGGDVPMLIGDGTNLTGAGDVRVQTITQGAPGVNEVQRATITWNSETSAGFSFSTTQWPWSSDGLTVWLSPNGGDQSSVLKQLFTEPDEVQSTDIEVTQVSTSTTSTVYDIEFRGDFGLQDITSPTIANVDSDNDATIAVATTTAGSSTPIDEVQRVTILNEPTGGTFILSFEGAPTAGIAYNAAAGTVEAALELVAGATDVSVTKTDNYYDVTMVDPAGEDIEQMFASPSSLTGSAVRVSRTQSYADAVNEVQEVSLDDQPLGGTFTLTWDPGGGDETTGNIPYNETAANLQADLEGLTTPTAGDFIVTGGAGGPWQVEFTGTYAGTDVNAMSGDATNLTGGGTQTLSKSTSQAAEGPNDFSLADNWDTGTAPVTDDIIVIDGSVDILYGLAQNSISPAEIIIKSGFTGQIGLPRYTGTYYEYRDTELYIGNVSVGASASMKVVVGEGDGEGSGLIRLRTGDKQTLLEVHGTATSIDGEVPSLTWRGDHASNTVDISQGSLGVAYFEGQTASILTLNQSFQDSLETDTDVTLESGVTLTNWIKTGGTAKSQCAIPYLKHIAGEIVVEGTGELTELIALGGTVYVTTTGICGNNAVITGATAADPVVITTSTAHGLTTGDKVRIASVVGMTEINQREFTVDVLTNTTFSLVGEDGSGHTAYSSGGVVGELGVIQVRSDATLDFSRSVKARQVATAIDVIGNDATVKDDGDVMTTLTFLSGEFAVQFHGTDRAGELGGQNSLWVRS